MYGTVLQDMAINVWEYSTIDGYICIGMFYKGGL